MLRGIIMGTLSIISIINFAIGDYFMGLFATIVLVSWIFRD